MASAASETSEIHTLSGFTKYVDRVCKEDMEEYDAAHVAAEMMKRLIRNAGGHRALNIDAKLLAGRVARQMHYAAERQLDAARAMRAAHAILMGAYSAKAAEKKPTEKAFDPTK
jgi:hypothetical protein